MNKEEKLKNILEELQDAVDYPRIWIPTMDGTDEEEMANNKYLEADKCKILLEYIKILQQESKQLKEIINKIKELMDKDQCVEYCYREVDNYLLELEKGDSNE